jgi:hypothetical protein
MVALAAKSPRLRRPDRAFAVFRNPGRTWKGLRRALKHGYFVKGHCSKRSRQHTRGRGSSKQATDCRRPWPRCLAPEGRMGLHCGCSCFARRGPIHAGSTAGFEQHSPSGRVGSPMTPQSDVALQYPDSVLMKHALRALTEPACLA